MSNRGVPVTWTRITPPPPTLPNCWDGRQQGHSKICAPITGDGRAQTRMDTCEISQVLRNRQVQRSLARAIVHLAAVCHAPVEKVLRHSPASLFTPGGWIAGFARRIGHVSQGLALP